MRTILPTARFTATANIEERRRLSGFDTAIIDLDIAIIIQRVASMLWQSSSCLHQFTMFCESMEHLLK